MLSNVSNACPYIYLVIIVKWSIDDQVLDLAFMTNYSQSTFMRTVASSLSVFAQIQYCPGRSSNRGKKRNIDAVET